VADPRSRYLLARELSSLGDPFPGFSAVQEALASSRPVLARGVTRAQGQRLIELLSARGLPVRSTLASSETNPVSGEGRMISIPVLAGGLTAALLAVVALVVFLQFRADPLSPKVRSLADKTSPAGRSLSTRDLAELVTPSTVMLRNGDSLGSGFLVGKDLVLTNAHVVAGSGAVTVVFSDGSKAEGVRSAKYEDFDLALVRVPGLQGKPLTLGDATVLHTGDRVMFVGTPEGLEFTVHEGIVSNTAREILGTAYLQLDANVNPGNSGGPVVDSFGRVVGVITAKVDKAEGLGFMLPINYAYEKGPQGEIALLAKPSTLPHSQKWKTLLVQVAESEKQSIAKLLREHTQPVLLGISQSSADGTFSAVIGRFAGSEPAGEPVVLKLSPPAGASCVLQSEIKRWDWYPYTSADAGSDQRVRVWLRKHGVSRSLYRGLAPLDFKACSQVTSGSELMLEGGDPSADRLTLP
jgi:serine protease Do